MDPLVVNTLTFLGAFFAVFAGSAVLADIRASDQKRLRQRVEEQLRQRQRQRAHLQEFEEIVAGARREGEGRTPLKEWLRNLVEQSGIDISPSRLATIALAAGLGAGAGFGLLFRSPVVGVSTAIVAGVIPILYVQLARSRRLERLRAQVPDAFDLISRVVRAGQTTTQAMRAVADEFPRPISLEFLLCHEQMNLGLSAEDALRDLARRTGLLELKIFALAVVVHRQTGGNLAELLDKLAEVVRERFRIRGMVKSLTAQGRLQAGILLSLPPVMFVLLMILRPEYEILVIKYPIMIVMSLSMMAVGALWIRRIVNFDF